jgi:hypothetical protein
MAGNRGKSQGGEKAFGFGTLCSKLAPDLYLVASLQD